MKPEVFVYKIPPRQSARGYRAADWNLSVPDWTGRMRLMEKGQKVRLKLEDRGSNELFAACPIEQYPGPAVEAVTDSSRYFVIRISDEGGRTAFIGIGFSDRSDSFDFNVALQDYFKGVTRDDAIKKEEEEVCSKPQLDLAFKAGQTIKVNINIPKSDKAKPRPKTGGGLLPPPPGVGAIKSQQGNNENNNQVPGQSALTPLSSPVDSTKSMAGPTPTAMDLLGGLDLSPLQISNPPPSTTLLPTTNTSSKPTDDPWGEFESAGVSDGKTTKEWVGF